jgi:hypothetical protein
VKLNKYFEDVNEFANENFFSFDGDFEFADEDFGFDYESDGYSADGGSANAAPTSQPYIINVQNTTAANISNVTILGAYTFIGTSSPAYGNASGISITMGITNVTYTEFLYQSMNSPFSVGMTYIQSLGGSSAQITQPITLNTQDANGNQALKSLIITIDPYQQQTSVVAVKQLYRIDGYTKLTISTLLPNAVVQFQFYPADNINLARGLSGRPATRNFGKPAIVKDSVAVIGGDVVRARLG